jgi:hypothetical protein
LNWKNKGLPNGDLNDLLSKECDMNNQDEISRGRRRFLRQTVTATGSGVLVLLTAGQDDEHLPPGDAVTDAAPVSRGYRVTDHIRSYYATLRS